jgi:DNA-binding LacI/PurR family transcriptional regulator
MRKPVSAAEVARRAGVSPTTVSFVLNNTPGKSISEQTRQRVLKAAAELNYLPNGVARSLAMRRRYTVSVIVRESLDVLSDAFLLRIVEGLSQELNRHRFGLAVRPARLRRGRYLGALRAGGSQGAILINATERDPCLEELSRSGFPLVVIGSLAEATIPQVDIDNRAAAQEAVQHLIGLGHRRIALIAHAPLAQHTSSLRHRGYLDAMAAAGLDTQEDWIREGDFSERGGYREMYGLLHLEPRPTAVFAGNDSMAYGALQAIEDAGLEVPRDISLVGFDDDTLSRYLDPPLTSVSIPAGGLGSRAARLLVELISEPEAQAERRIVLPTSLSIRASTRRVQSQQ